MWIMVGFIFGVFQGLVAYTMTQQSAGAGYLTYAINLILYYYCKNKLINLYKSLLTFSIELDLYSTKCCWNRPSNDDDRKPCWIDNNNKDKEL